MFKKTKELVEQEWQSEKNNYEQSWANPKKHKWNHGRSRKQNLKVNVN